MRASQLRLKADVGETVTPQRGERLDALAAQWLAVIDLTRRRRTAYTYRRQINRHVLPVFGRFEPRAITRNAVEVWHGTIAAKTPVEANRALAAFSALMAWIERDGRIDRNLCRGTRRAPESPRQVFLDEDEIAAAHSLLDADPNQAAALALKLSLLTGCRISEALSLRPDQIDVRRKVWIKPHALTKQRRAHILPLQDAAVAVALALPGCGSTSYSACCRVWQKVRIRIGRPDAPIHVLRHSRASALARHSSPSATARYAHLVDRDLISLIARTR